MEASIKSGVEKETELLSQLCKAITSSSTEYQKIIQKGLPKFYLGLDHSRVAECTEHFENYFGTLTEGLRSLETWKELANLLQELSLRSYFNEGIFFGPSSDPQVNTCVCEYLDIFFTLISSHFYEVREVVMTVDIDEFPFHDMSILTDQNIKDLFKDRVQGLNALSQLNFLSKLRRFYKISHGRFFLHYDFQSRRIYKLDRNLDDLNKWIVGVVKDISPLICLKNRTQKEGIRFFFLEAMAEKKIEIDDFETFLESRFYVQGTSPNAIGKGDFNVALGERGEPSELIREIFVKLTNLKADNSKRNIQKWLFHLFFSHEGEGFSTYNIKKVTESIPNE